MTNILLKNVHVINLERSEDRLEQIDNNLKKFGIKYQRFNAVDGKKLSMGEIDRITTTSCRYMICNRSSIGCAISHITLWGIISQSNDKWHLVLEDDAEFTDETIDFVNKLSKSSLMDDDNIIINLACDVLSCYGSHIQIDSENGPINNLIVPLFPLGTRGYLITKNTANKLHNYFMRNRMSKPIDLSLAEIYSELKIKYLSTEYPIIKLADSGKKSTIDDGSPSLYILSSILDKLGFSRIVWYLSYPFMNINLYIPINGFIILFLILLIFNFFLINSAIVYIYLLLELLIAIVLKIMGKLY